MLFKEQMNSVTLLQEAERALVPIFSEIDAQVKHNLKKTLEAFRHHRVGVHHFASVSGYGHDDLGRETLDQVFAEVMGAQAAAVRVQFVSGTHAIACALFGVLRPGDEMLAVMGRPYDTLEEVSRRPSGLRKTIADGNSLAHRTTWLRSDLWVSPLHSLAPSPYNPQSLSNQRDRNATISGASSRSGPRARSDAVRTSLHRCLSPGFSRPTDSSVR